MKKNNSVMYLKGNPFMQQKRPDGQSCRSMPIDAVVNTKKIDKLITELETVLDYWNNLQQKYIKDILVVVLYNKIVAKSNRIQGLLKGPKSNYSIVSIKYDSEIEKSIVTYYLEKQYVNKTILLLKKIKQVLLSAFNGTITSSYFKEHIQKNKYTAHQIETFNEIGISKSKFLNVISDISYIEKFIIEPKILESKEEGSLVTFYDVKEEIISVLEKIGIKIHNYNIVDEFTIYLTKAQLEKVSNTAPYLVSMSCDSHQSFYEKFSNEFIVSDTPSIKKPNDEPTIGVIDTLFDDKVYFSEWVEYVEMINQKLERTTDDYTHGTAVTSIIVDGPRLNPDLEDNCGNFRVKHFGVSLGKSESVSSLIRNIKNIIIENSHIKVWNLSLGSDREIDNNYISIIASCLDEIQYNYDVIFIIAGTNDRSKMELKNANNQNHNVGNSVKKIGSPADSINSIVVNSVTRKNKPVSYARKGIVLSFFNKPDVSYYGGDYNDKIIAYTSLGARQFMGTSFAAPWITRKVAYLIEVLGLPREVAKALIIDSAKQWDKKDISDLSLTGYGVVPIDINDIINTNDDEIRFIVSDVSKEWNNYNYKFPFPLDKNKYPFMVRAVMCYTPLCNRNQGVDYTNTELSLSIGRINDNDENNPKFMYTKKDKIDSIDQNSEHAYLYEKDARLLFRKWDNVKCISEHTKNPRPKTSYKNKNWGMEVKTNNRLNSQDSKNVRFAIVVTLKEINGINRIDEFKKNFHLNGWQIIDINTRQNIYQKAQETIEII